MTQIEFLDTGQSLADVDWKSGVFLPIDKPANWTSFDVVNKIRNQLRRITGTKRIKVGHAGTLDPRATGLLILACGAATKQIQSIMTESKSYSGAIQLGYTTPTYDGEMEPDEEFAIDHITPEMIAAAEKEYTGKIMQRPPIYSAIKKDGKRLYQYARKNQHIDIPARPVDIFDLQLEFDMVDRIHFSCTCSKGTYIRSLAHDIGAFLESGAYLASLIRTAIGDYPLKRAWQLDELIKKMTSINN